MKAVWFSLILLISLFIFVFTNANYIQKTSTELKELTQALKNEPTQGETFSQLESLWKQHRNRISISVGFGESDNFDEALKNLNHARQINNQTEFERYRLKLLDVIEKFERAEQSSWQCLF